VFNVPALLLECLHCSRPDGLRTETDHEGESEKLDLLDECLSSEGIRVQILWNDGSDPVVTGLQESLKLEKRGPP